MFPTTFTTNAACTIWSRDNGSGDVQSHGVLDSSGTPHVFFDASTTTGNARPNRTASGVLSYNDWWHVAAIWTGSILATGITLYAGKNGQPVIQQSIGTSNDGTGTAKDSVANSFAIGARTAVSTVFKGHIAYVARWNRVLTLAELQQAQKDGPISVPQGLILFWANGRDYSPYEVTPTSIANVAAGISPTFSQRVKVRPFRKLVAVPAAPPPPANSNRWFLMQ